MTIEVDLSPETEKRLQERAAAMGMDVAGYLSRLIDRDLKRRTPIDELMAPVHEAFERSGMTDQELVDMSRRALDAVRNDKG